MNEWTPIFGTQTIIIPEPWEAIGGETVLDKSWGKNGHIREYDI